MLTSMIGVDALVEIHAELTRSRRGPGAGLLLEAR